MYGGMGTYGGMYGGVNSLGYGGMGYGSGFQVDPNDPNSLTNTLGQSTQATFRLSRALLERLPTSLRCWRALTWRRIARSLVGHLLSRLQFLPSQTTSRTDGRYPSLAMVSVAEQFGNLRNTLGSILGIFAILRWFRSLLARLTGRSAAVSTGELTPFNFASFESRRDFASRDGRSSVHAPRPSRKPLLVFIFAVFGLPYLMGKLIRAIARNQGQNQGGVGDPNATALTVPASAPSILDPSKLEFCRVLYDFDPEDTPGLASSGMDLAVKKGDLVAVLSKTDPMGNASEWWRCRARDGRVGYLPSPYLEVIQLVRPAFGTGAVNSTSTIPAAVRNVAITEAIAAANAARNAAERGTNSSQTTGTTGIGGSRGDGNSLNRNQGSESRAAGAGSGRDRNATSVSTEPGSTNGNLNSGFTSTASASDDDEVVSSMLRQMASTSSSASASRQMTSPQQGQEHAHAPAPAFPRRKPTGF